MARIRALAVACVLVNLVGCAHRPAVSSDERLPLKRVVVYRNGVAYFERAGTVRGERVEFQVKPEHVGDFLATLSVVEQGGSSVRSASFPISVDESVPVPEDGEEGAKAQRLIAQTLKKVVLELDGDEHDLRVGYVSEQPVWRPSYRLIFDRDTQRPVLQAWGIIQNVSGEDWKDVSLSLVAGAPIAFESTLATPVTPQRPVVLDSGELIAAVPRGENTLAQRPMPAPAPVAPASPQAEMQEWDEEAEMDQPQRPGRYAPGAPSAAPARPNVRTEKRAADRPVPPVTRAPPVASASPRHLAQLAGAHVQAGTTRYDLPNPVTVPNESATMVLLVSRPVPGESVFMYAPDHGVAESLRHPFRVVRFTNDTPGLMERGPIAVLQSGAFLGQGLLEPLAAGAEATVPFALERALAVDQTRQDDTRDARLAHIEAGQLTIERDQVVRTTYRVRNGQAEQARVLLRHPRVAQMRLHEAPKGTDDRVGQGNALVPAVVGPHETAEVVVDERRAFKQVVDWFSPWADEAVKAYLADPRAKQEVASSLKALWGIRDELVRTREERQKLESERRIVDQAAHATRANLNSLKRNAGARVDQLRQQLAGRLSELDRRNAELLERATALSLKENELRIRFEDQVRQLNVEKGLPPTKVTWNFEESPAV